MSDKPVDTDGDDDAGLGERPSGDVLVLEVARSRIADALFATGERVSIGRYQLLQRAGAGGMGVVWSAWDPELERRVAIKLMHVKSEIARQHMLREGQSLAKLSHPNIVPIYDVGTVDDQVYLVMEWIAGVTLRAYCAEPRGVRELVAIYLAAGTGVAAAHRTGIVQRDFKPDNVMIGDDGRVRVLDFGLARADQGEGSVAGTPRYMAPEQARGDAPTPAADQYSFGIALGESLAKRGEVAAWLAAVVTRATAPEPGKRYPDMDALLAALARDPARVWRRRAVAAGAVVAAGVAFAIGTLRTEPDTCTGAGGELAAVWNPVRAAELVAHVRTLGPYGAEQAKSLADQLSRYGTRWVDARRGACRARQRADITVSLYERGLACFERSRAALDGVAAAMTRASIDQLPNTVVAARDLPDVERCIADATTDTVRPPSAAIAARVSAVGADATKARYLALASDPAASALARSAARAAEELAYLPLVARAQLALGAALESDPASDAVGAYRTATDAALQAGDDIAFVEAFARQLFVASRRRDTRAPGLASALELVATIARRTGDGGRFARALLYNNAGSERLAAGDPTGAIAWLRKARDEPVPRTGGAELWAILGNLAMVVPDRTERDKLFVEERARLEATLGVDHPFTLQIRLRAAMYVEHPGEAATRLRELCATYARLHPHRHDKIGNCSYELGWLAVERGDPVEAQRALAIAVAHPTDQLARTETAKAEIARLAGDARGAARLAERVAVAAEQETTWWDRYRAVDAWLVVAAARATLGERDGSIAALQLARTVLADPRLNSQAIYIQRRRARVTSLLALATRDRKLAGEALAWYRAAGGYDSVIRALTR